MLLEKEAPKNGWAYVYLSNESDEPVYFDNFQVTHERGRIIEENHYYSYGLKIDGISSRAQETVLNRYGYQGDFSEHDEETALDEFDLRHFDPQTGRWTTTDPYEQFANPYLGMGNSPVGNVDVDGGFAGWQGALSGAIIGFALPYAIEGIGKIFDKDFTIKDKAAWGALGAFIGSGLGYGIQEKFWGENRGSLSQNIKAYYKGLFGGHGYIYPSGSNVLNESATGADMQHGFVRMGICAFEVVMIYNVLS